uniref:Putative secreted protein n=1 Tax=Anopheles darlingi TaxID=43151 RepID=A0A2M4DPJ8_ANODA
MNYELVLPLLLVRLCWLLVVAGYALQGTTAASSTSIHTQTLITVKIFHAFINESSGFLVWGERQPRLINQ